MKNIFFRDGILIYYGNPAGYLSEGKVVLDSIFDKEEIIAFLSEKEKLAVEIRSGVYDRLSEGGGMEMTVEASKGRRIRIYQLIGAYEQALTQSQSSMAKHHEMQQAPEGQAMDMTGM